MTDDKWGAGDRSKWSNWGEVRISSRDYPLIWGEHKHGYSENKMYVVRDQEAEPIPFDGHRILIDVILKSENYLKESELSGDEYRRGGSCEIVADREVVYGFFFRDVQEALLRAHHLIDSLGDHPSSWLDKESRQKLVGRKVYYEQQPALVKSLIADQGCVILVPDGAPKFAPPVWDPDYDGDRTYAKVEVLDKSIWWFRD